MTEEDVAYFQPTLQDFIEKYGFEKTWNISAIPVKEPEHCSEHIVNLAGLREIDPNRHAAVEFDPDALKTAVEDRKFNAIRHRLKVLSAVSDKESRAERLELLTILGEMGYYRSARAAAFQAIRVGQFSVAAQSFWNSIVGKHRERKSGIGSTKRP